MKTARQPPEQAEQEAHWIGRHNYVINSEIVLRDAYRLLCLFLADEGIARESQSAQDIITKIRDQFVEDEMVHLLFSVAVMNRAQEDHMYGLRHDAPDARFPPVTHNCGTLIADVNDEVATEEPLTGC